MADVKKVTSASPLIVCRGFLKTAVKRYWGGFGAHSHGNKNPSRKDLVGSKTPATQQNLHTRVRTAKRTLFEVDFHGDCSPHRTA